MTVEPHPYPERTLWRIGPPVAAGVLAAVIFAVMLAVPSGLAQTVVLVVVLVVQFVLVGGRSFYLRRSARLEGRAVRWHQFLFAWSGFASGSYLISRDYSLASAALHVVGGLLFAGLFMSLLVASVRFLGRAAEADPTPMPRTRQGGWGGASATGRRSSARPRS